MNIVCPCCSHQFPHNTLEQRLWNQIIKTDNTDDCWNWVGPVNSKKYGSLCLATKRKGVRKSTRFYAHRLAWELTNGPISDGLFVCHKCDNPRCCNPNHLFLGTPKENVEDMILKGRYCKHRLRKQQIKDIRNEYANGASQQEIATKYNVPYKVIHRVIFRKTWKKID
jgi:hypothetical protein